MVSVCRCNGLLKGSYITRIVIGQFNVSKIPLDRFIKGQPNTAGTPVNLVV